MKSNLTFLFLVLFLSNAAGQPDDRVAKTPKINYDWQPGYVNITEFTGGPGLSTTNVPYAKYYYGITTVNGYQFTRNIKAGIGVGIHKHNEGTLFPVYLDARYSFNANELVPFIAAAGGLALDFNDLNTTRVFINPSLGIKWVVANRTGLSFSGGVMTMSGGSGRNSFVSFKLGLELKGK